MWTELSNISRLCFEVSDDEKIPVFAQSLWRTWEHWPGDSRVSTEVHSFSWGFILTFVFFHYNPTGKKWLFVVAGPCRHSQKILFDNHFLLALTWSCSSLWLTHELSRGDRSILCKCIGELTVYTVKAKWNHVNKTVVCGVLPFLPIKSITCFSKCTYNLHISSEKCLQLFLRICIANLQL